MQSRFDHYLHRRDKENAEVRQRERHYSLSRYGMMFVHYDPLIVDLPQTHG